MAWGRSPSDRDGISQEEIKVKTILETLAEDGSFQTLLSTLDMVELSARLSKPGPFTLFAPNDAAFQRVNLEELKADADNLRSILSYHLLTGKMTSAEISQNESLYTECGKSLTVHLEEGLPVIDNGKYVKADIECSNGVIHVIDNVFLPQFSGWYCACC
jgi:uncharacterized surface protein with fasciclin (FAS1) repeats